MSKLFNQVSFGKPQRSLIDLSHEKKMSMNMGDLVPFMLLETVPGDKFRMNVESLVRFAPLVAPVMHRVNAYFHFFYVPNRLVYDKFEQWVTGGADGKQSAQTALPYLYTNSGNIENWKIGSLADYMGLPLSDGTVPIPDANRINISALPFRAYQLIYNQYYRDQNLTPEVPITTHEGLITDPTEIAETLALRHRSWEKDYFTSALPWSQRGDEIELPTSIEYKQHSVFKDSQGETPSSGGPLSTSTIDANGGRYIGDGIDTGRIENLEGIGITINDLRRSARLQEFLEKTARGGSRLTEVVKAFFGVNSSDSRLQRAEFLGGCKNPVQISEVLSTFNNTEVPGANMYGHGVSTGNSKYIKKYCEEFGYIIGIMSVIPRTAYANQGIHKMWRKFDKYDLYWPTFAQLGEQEVKEWEIYVEQYGQTPTYGTFGYQSRYAEYKHMTSQVAGDFRKTLNYWHMARIFDQMPVLNTDFVESEIINRVFADTESDVHHLWVQLYNDVKAVRPMPYFNNPIL
ncbi:MAG: major capsid protein [Microviridae sp.]|nr:MAG: major capsid protein [Microviridae sp.]